MLKDSKKDFEIRLFLEALFLKYGYDFRNYSLSHIKRRIAYRMAIEKIDTISQMQEKLLCDESFAKEVVSDFSINVTDMFRDVGFFSAMRNKVLPNYKNVPEIKIWHAGCSTGQEVYSMAILLHEMGLLNKSRIYASDFNYEVLSVAKRAEYDIKYFKAYADNYYSSGGKYSFYDYCDVNHEKGVLRDFLRKNIVFFKQNLVSDKVSTKYDLIFCRNVLIYFNTELQHKVFKKLVNGLLPNGILSIGGNEAMKYNDRQIILLDEKQKIYKKS